MFDNLKYESTLVTFTEVPDEISLCFNITGCPCYCKECFEPWLAEDNGEILSIEVLLREMRKHRGITCVCFMGGDRHYDKLRELIDAAKLAYPEMKWAMYSGRPKMNELVEPVLDYYKIGPYIPEFGPMNKTTTNQVFYRRGETGWEDITYKFQTKKA